MVKVNDHLQVMLRRESAHRAIGQLFEAESVYDMNDGDERNLGEQPIVGVMRAIDVKPHDIVAASAVQMTHKMVARAMKGRRLTPNVKCKVRDALNAARGTSYVLGDLFNY